MLRTASLCLFAATLIASPVIKAADPLPGFNVDISQTSISGLSSGAFMSVQFGFAHSSIIKGVGVVAGGPYYCAQGNVMTAIDVCTCTSPLPAMCHNVADATKVSSLVTKVQQFAKGNKIDDPANVRKQKIYLYGGAKDVIVPPPVFGDLQSFYGKFVDPANIKVVSNSQANHTMPTPDYGNECSALGNPFISKCGSDTAGEILDWIYGPLQPRQNGVLQGRFVEFNQRAFSPDMLMGGMDDTAWLYVPKDCEAGTQCRLHVVMHGCNQGQSYIPTSDDKSSNLYYGTQYVKKTGYNEWADTNRIILLYPQAVVTALNPQGCWDWWGYASRNYALKSGNQIQAIRAMIDTIAKAKTQAKTQNKTQAKAKPSSAS